MVTLYLYCTYLINKLTFNVSLLLNLHYIHMYSQKVSPFLVRVHLLQWKKWLIRAVAVNCIVSGFYILFATSNFMNNKVKYTHKIYIIAIPDCWLTSSEQVFSHIMARIIYILTKIWWFVLSSFADVNHRFTVTNWDYLENTIFT